ncbi:hypothetical protein [Cerasicoccus arenae]|uniref:hypothetical protein n=1 Tax=Cerasicoccus arenae TaxID=424488 RepID=UPI001676841F|nr:hypothetical protein [Cerasicoccus arenae]MBK1859938.1 hypothetical protein [Cerasicoccus arenae]
MKSLLTLFAIFLMPSLALANESGGGTLIQMSSVGSLIVITSIAMVVAEMRKNKSDRK